MESKTLLDYSDDSNDSDDDANKSVTQFKTPMRVIIEKMPG